MKLETPRLILRPWQDSDAADLYQVAKDARVGPIAGWPPHSSVEHSAEIIQTVFKQPEVYALELRTRAAWLAVSASWTALAATSRSARGMARSPTG